MLKTKKMPKLHLLVYCLFFLAWTWPGFSQNLPYLPPELISAFEDKLPDQLPRPTKTGQFRKLAAGAGFVWIAEADEAPEKGNLLAFRMNFDGTLEENEVAFLAIRARTVSPSAELNPDPRPGRIRIHIAERENLRQTALFHLASVGRNWGWYYHPFRAAKAIASDAGVVRFSFDLQKQAIEIEEVGLYLAPKGFDMARLPMMSAGYQGREANAPWRQEAVTRIRKHRTAPLCIEAFESTGSPLKKTVVHARMIRHAFGFGSTFKSKYLLENTQDARRYRDTFDELYSCLVPVPMLIPRHTPMMHSGNYANQQLLGLGKVLQWGSDRHMNFRGHTLVWGNLQPWSNEWVKENKPEEILKYLREHRNYLFSLTKDIIREWDAINHPLRFQKDLRDVFGENIYRDLLAEQRKATDATLIINEALFDNAREEAFHQLMVHLQKSNRTQADGIGFQSHFTVHNLRGMEDLWRRYQRFAPLVKQMAVTEYDLICNDNQLHADYLRDILTLTFSHPKMTSFITWGFWAGDHWKPEGALIRKDWKERPAVKVWRDLVKGKWWTEGSTATNEQGKAVIDGAFFGVYEITVGASKNPHVVTHLPHKQGVSLTLP
jgi:endo-1,4-beta-xylanase